MKKLLSVLLTLIIVFSILTCGGITTLAADLSGKCGYGVNWKYTESNKTLTISGDNIMDDYSKSGNSYNRPWESLAGVIESVVIKDGVLSVGDYAFAGCKKLKDVTIPDSVLVIGEGAFKSCTNMRYVDIGTNVLAIGASAFENCENLRFGKLSVNTVYIGDNAFEGCSVLNIIYTGTPANQDFIRFEDRNEYFNDICHADTVYALTLHPGQQGMLTIVRDEKFTLHLENESKAKTLGTEYGTLTEDGVKYYYGAIAVEAIKYGTVTVVANDSKNNVLYEYSIGIICENGEHSYWDGALSATPTCQLQGLKTYKCTECNYVKSEIVDKVSHQFVFYKVVKLSTCTEYGVERSKCTYCDEYSERQTAKIDHNWGDWDVILEPTEEEKGKMVHKCIICGEEEISNIPTLSNVLGDANNDKKITAVDARLVLQYVAGVTEFTAHELKLADVNGDGNVTAVDARFILRKVAGIIA